MFTASSAAASTRRRRSGHRRPLIAAFVIVLAALVLADGDARSAGAPGGGRTPSRTAISSHVPAARTIADLAELERRHTVDELTIGELGVVDLVRGRLSEPTADPVAALESFLGTYGALFGLREPRDELFIDRVEADDLGMTHIRLRQRHDGVPVVYGELRAHVGNSGVLETVHGNVLPELEVSTRPQLARELALRIAAADREIDPSRWRAELAVYRHEGAYHLVWRARASTSNPPGRWEWFIDAVTGEILHRANRIPDLAADAFPADPMAAAARPHRDPAVTTGVRRTDPLGTAPRVEASFEVLASTGSTIGPVGPVVGLGRGPSINDAGKVAFVARDEPGEHGWVLVVGASGVERSLEVPAGTTLSNEVQINNAGQVSFRERVDATAESRIRRIDGAAATTLVSSSSSSFWLMHPWTSLNNLGVVVLSGELRGGGSALAVADGASPLQISPDLPDLPSLYPLLADDGRTVVRWGADEASPLLIFTDPSLSTDTALLLASADAYSAIGSRPGISDDGEVAVFKAIHPDGARLFGGVVDGMNPVTVFPLLSLAQEGVELDYRIAVNRAPGGVDGEYVLAYVAKDEDDRRGVYVQRLDVADPAMPLVSAPGLVIATGDTVDGISGAIVDVDCYDLINSSGELACYVATSEAEAVVRAVPDLDLPPLDQGAGIGVIGDLKDHIDTTFDSGRFILDDRSRRIDHDPHGHGGRMQSAASIRTYGFSGRPPGQIMQDDDNVWDAPEQATGVDAHVYAGWTYDFLNHEVERNGFDDLGTSMVSTVEYDCQNNAFWNGQQVGYCEASGGLNPLSGDLDVVAHEWGHAVTEFTSNLVYEREPGALNESFSDIMGVRLLFAHDDPGWRLAKNFNGVGIRDVRHPLVLGDPECRGGAAWIDVDGCVPSQNNDWCGVHTNSGVPNRMFYLLSEGGTDGRFTVEGIGIDDAFRVMIRANRFYFTETTDFDQAKALTMLAADDLEPSGNWSSQLESAWNIVCVGAPPNLAPIANAGGPYRAEVGELIQFDGTGSNDPDGSITTYAWDFGDGRLGSGPQPWHAYESAGMYTVGLLVIDSSGAQSIDQTAAQIGPPSAVALSSFQLVPTAGAVTVRWETAFEDGHRGFHVERSAPHDDGFVRITRDLIPARGAGGGVYEFVDRDVAAGETYGYRLKALDLAGTWQLFELGSVTVERALPSRVLLHQNRPNPFNPRTTIAFELPVATHVVLRIYDGSGRAVRVLADGAFEAGPHSVDWDGRDDRGRPLESGVYAYRLIAGPSSQSRKIVLLR